MFIIALTEEFFFNKFSSMQKLSIFTSINSGLRPHCTRGHKDVDQHIAGIKNLSPGLNFPFFLGLIRANAARRFAEDPEFTINAYLDPTNFEKANSNFFVISDIVSFLLNKTSIPLIMSSFVKPFSKRG